MITQKTIDRINELYHKSKIEEGLTELEGAEQRRLRKEYVEAFRANTLAAMKKIKIQHEDGTVELLVKEEGVSEE